MTTVVNNPAGTGTERDSGLGLAIALIMLLVFAFLLFYYGLPVLRGGFSSGGGNNPAPQVQNQEGPSIDVPERVDVNVNPGGGANPAPAQ